MENNNNTRDQHKKTLLHICEVCDKTELLTPADAYDQGWDYPPKMGIYKLVSPRKCGDCGMLDTLWYELVVRKTPRTQLSPRHKLTLIRILTEPESIMPKD